MIHSLAGNPEPKKIPKRSSREDITSNRRLSTDRRHVIPRRKIFIWWKGPMIEGDASVCGLYYTSPHTLEVENKWGKEEG